MQNLYRRSLQTAASYLSLGLLAATSFAFAQEPYPPQQQTASTGGWRRVGDGQTPSPDYGSQDAYSQQPSYPANQPAYSQQPSYPPANQPYPPANQPAYGQAPYNQGNYPPPQNQQPQAPVPAQLTMPAGTFVTVRVNQYLSSDRNQAGDAFSATLVQPLVVNGVVVAEPGQTIAGRVIEAQKAGRIEGTARLGVQLTEVTLVDGQQIPIRSQFISRQGPTSVGRDVGAIAGTTALGAAIGAAAGWGTGAAIGAGAGAAAGTIGVLLTRGHPSVIAPEQVLTFRIEAPVTIATDRASQAFRYVQPNEYDRPIYNQPAPQVQYAPPVPAPYYAYGYGYPYYPYYYGPSFSFFVGRGFYYGRPYYYGRGYYGGFHRR